MWSIKRRRKPSCSWSPSQSQTRWPLEEGRCSTQREMGLEQSSESLTSLIGHNPGGERGPEGRERSARLVASGQSSWQAVGQATLGWEKADPRDPSGLSPCGPQDPQVTQTGCGSGATQRPLLHPLQPRPCLSPTRVHSAQGGTWGSIPFQIGAED